MTHQRPWDDSSKIASGARGRAQQVFFATVLAELDGLLAGVQAIHARADGPSNVEHLPNDSFYRCLRAVQDVDARLGLLVGGTLDTPEIVITANGDQSAFGAVVELVANAPEIPGWFVRAFRPRLAPEFAPYAAITLRGREVGVSDITFRCARSPGRNAVDLILCVPGYDDAVDADTPPNSDISDAALLLLDHVLGEYDAVTRIWGMIVTGRPLLGLPLASLPAALDALVPPDVG